MIKALFLPTDPTQGFELRYYLDIDDYYVVSNLCTIYGTWTVPMLGETYYVYTNDDESLSPPGPPL